MQILSKDDFAQIHCGIISPSNFSKILAKGKMKSRRAYLDQLVDERITGISNLAGVDITNNRGYQLESEVRERYTFLHDTEVRSGLFVKRDDDIGGVPDGLLFRDGEFQKKGLEIKCYDTKKHDLWISGNKLPIGFIPQVQGYIWISEVEEWDFILYDPRSKTDYFEITVYRDDKYIVELEKNVNAFRQELHAIVASKGVIQ